MSATLARCHFCKRLVRYLVNVDTQLLVIVDPTPHEQGRIWVAGGLARLLTVEAAEVERRFAGREFHRSHFASCPARLRRFRERRGERSRRHA